MLHRHDLKKLRSLFLAGEPLDAPTLQWIKAALGQVQIIDNYRQTETGWPILTRLPGLGDIAPRAASPGFAA